jgi:predicted nucleic acid-binding protein
MPADFLDTSALAKHYHAEVGSAEIDRLWNDPAHGLFVSRLSALEIVSVFAGKVRAAQTTSIAFMISRSGNSSVAAATASCME